mgnify:CR=1 FL=1
MESTALVAMTEEEARTQIQRIKSHYQSFWFQLSEFHNRKGWLALGYSSFKACVETELGLSERRAYQLLDAASIRTDLDTEHMFSIDQATEGQLRELKALEPEQRVEVARQIDFASTSVREVREIVNEVKSPAHVSYNSGNNEWYTPSEYIEAAREVLGTIDLDPASSDLANRIVGASRYYTIEDDGLSKAWAGKVWMNPPYSADLVGKFTGRLAYYVESEEVPEAIVLVNNATETTWFRTLIQVASAVAFPQSRIRFIDPQGNPTGAPLQGQAVIYIGGNRECFASVFSRFGWVAFGDQTGRFCS